MKTVENVRCKGGVKKLLHSDGKSKWWAIRQMEKWADPQFLTRKLTAAAAAERARLANRSGKRCTTSGIVALIKVHDVIDTTKKSWRNHPAARNKRYKSSIIGGYGMAMLVRCSVHFDEPVECPAGGQGPILVPKESSKLIIERLKSGDGVFRYP